ncbi:hypothetical protein E2320_012530, partial [Naja naja]
MHFSLYPARLQSEILVYTSILKKYPYSVLSRQHNEKNLDYSPSCKEAEDATLRSQNKEGVDERAIATCLYAMRSIRVL